MPYTFAIIGGGMTATSLLCQLVDRLAGMGERGRRLAREFTVSVFEKKGVFGPGLPHSDEVVRPYHITNMCAEDMSVHCDQPGDFQTWAKQHPDAVQQVGRDPTAPADSRACGGEETCHHYPRAVMGEYLKTRFEEAVAAARNLGITVELQAGSEVTDLAEEEKHLLITMEGPNGETARTSRADGALLATGHWFETGGSRNYLPSPWPASKLLTAIPQGANVGVIGSSLSAIEVALTLTSDGRFERRPSGELVYHPSNTPRTLTLHSRNGLLPRVRGRVGRRPNLYLTCPNLRRLMEERPGKVALASVFELLDRELTAAYGSPVDWRNILNPPGAPAEILHNDLLRARRGDGPEGGLVWQTVLVEIFPVVRDLYLNLAPAERARFDRHFNTLFFMHAATQPAQNAEKLLALMQAGMVTMVRLGDGYRFERRGEDGPFEFAYTGLRGNTLRAAYPYVVNACGQPRSIMSDPAGLTHNLLKRGLVQTEESRAMDQEHSGSHETGSIVVDPETHRVVRPGADHKSRRSPPLYAVGAMTRGQMIDASMAYGITRATARVADDLMTRLTARYDP